MPGCPGGTGGLRDARQEMIGGVKKEGVSSGGGEEDKWERQDWFTLTGGEGGD